MTDRNKTTLFAVLAAICAASEAPIAATKDIRPIFIIMPLFAMGVLLLMCGYFAGRSRR